MPRIGIPELVIILAVVLIIFGVGKLPQIGGALGKSIHQFKQATRDDDDAADVKEKIVTAGAPPDK